MKKSTRKAATPLAQAPETAPREPKEADVTMGAKLFIVGGDKGGVGKTTSARLLVEYLEETGQKPRAFDTEFPRGSLARFHPKITKVIDITSIKSQIEVFDSVQTSRAPHVIDLRAGTFSNVLSTFEDIAVLQQMREGALDIYFFHVIGGNYEALGEVEDALDQLPTERHIIVKSHATDPDFDFWLESPIRDRFLKAGGRELVVPRLDRLVYETVDTNSTSFRAFVQNKSPAGTPAKFSLVLRGYCRKWLSDMFMQLSDVPCLQGSTGDAD